ncbi:MAG TPA: hypothetical protein VFN11_11800 [Ktedonobacterales bacterium]|nr:hypothetical protein [Ktedonobacterales bacterium]
MDDEHDPLPTTLGTADAYRRSAFLAIPFLLLVPLAYALWFHLWGVSLSWLAIGAGALGWYVAFVLRTPVVLIARLALRTPERMQPWIVAASGPAEESVRLITLLLVGSALPIALSVGLGWTTIEIVYTIINTLAIAWLLRRTDDRSRRSLALLRSMGLGNLLSPTAPALSVIERIAVSGLHIGFTLLIAWQPLLVLVTIPLHSVANLVSLRLLRRSAVLSAVGWVLIGAAILLAGLAVWGLL